MYMIVVTTLCVYLHVFVVRPTCAASGTCNSLLCWRQVKLAYQESELVTLLKKIPLGALEMAVIRERAEKLRDGRFKSRGDALLPLMLASFIFDSLCLPGERETG